MTTLRQDQHDHRECLRVAGKLLGAPVRALALDSDLEQMLNRCLRPERRSGLDSRYPLMQFTTNRKGREVLVGVETYRIETESGVLRVAKVSGPSDLYRDHLVCGFWAVAVEDHRRLYRFLRKLLRQQQSHPAPLMREDDRARLWHNTIGFLRHETELLRRYGVPQKRGVLLLGEPGNGKTMACRWLRSQCVHYGLEWRSVSAEQYESSREEGEAQLLFHLRRPGIIFFDDLDMALRDRNQFGQSPDHSTFLGALDGLQVAGGVVFVFTSNAQLAEIDPAFRRPGRIDLVMTFARPDAPLRRRFVTHSWHEEIARSLDVEEVVSATDGLSFAEMDEVKKQLVLRYLEVRRWDWAWAWKAYQSGRGGSVTRARIGFSRTAADIGLRHESYAS